MSNKTISEGLAAEKLNILSDKKRAKLRLILRLCFLKRRISGTS